MGTRGFAGTRRPVASPPCVSESQALIVCPEEDSPSSITRTLELEGERRASDSQQVN